MPDTTPNAVHLPAARTRRRSTRGFSVGDELERRERQLAALYELWRATPYTEPRRLYQMLTERATAAMDAHTCSLLLRDRGTDTLRMTAAIGLPADVTESVTLLVGERIAGRVAASRQPILLNKDPNTHPLLKGPGDGAPPAQIEARPEVESALCAPLLDMAGEAIGVLCLSRHAPAAPFNDADLRVFSLFAAQVGYVIAERQKVEDLTREAEERARIEREMAQSAHLASLGQFAAMVAHEMRNPLSSIKGAAQFLLQEGENADAATLRDFLTIVVEEVDGLGSLTTDLLEFARPTPPVRERRDLGEIVRGEAAFLRDELIRIGVADLRVTCPDEPVWVAIDAGQIGRALRNLLLNAAQSLASVGNAMVSGRVLVRLETEGDDALLTVEDNGPGLPDNVRDRLFEPFFTTKAKGSGLGLAQVKRTIQLHQGDVCAENASGGGARFTIRLPKEA